MNMPRLGSRRTFLCSMVALSKATVFEKNVLYRSPPDSASIVRLREMVYLAW